MRIGFFTDSYLPSKDGVAISVETFRQKLEEQGHEVYVFCPKAASDFHDPSPRVKRFRAYSSWMFDGARESWPLNPRIYVALRKLNLDIIHAHTQFNIGLLGTYLAKSENIPLVTTCHADFEAYAELYRRFLPGLFFMNLVMPVATKEMPDLKESLNLLQPERSIGTWNKKLMRQLVRNYADQCDVVTVPSDKIKLALQEIGVDSPIEVISTGVDASLFQPAAPFLRQQFGLEGKTIILYAGRIKSEKNVDLILQSFAQIAPKYPNAVAVLLGPGKYQEELKELAVKLNIANQVIFAGAVTRDQILAAMKESDIFAFPSVTDTQALVVNEAVLAGLPLVLVDRELFEVAVEGRNAVYADNLVDSYAEQLQGLLADPQRRAKMAQESINISQQFDAAQQATKMADCYRRLLADHAQRMSETEPSDGSIGLA